MPRILPRLRKVISEGGSGPRTDILWPRRRNSKKSLCKPVPPRPTFKVADYKESILLTPGNPITNSRDYVRHKTVPPRLRLKRRVVAASPTNNLPREMTKEERKWWADPYRKSFEKKWNIVLQSHIWKDSPYDRFTVEKMHSDGSVSSIW